MAEQTEICNMALSIVGDESITGITSGTPQADACNLVYHHLRRAMLRAHDWGWASQTEVLSASTEDPPADWAYRYVYPANCIAVRELYLGTTVKGDPPLPYAVEQFDAGNAKSILSDVDGACARFTSDVTDEALFDDQFAMAFVWRLASEIAIPLTRKPAIQTAAFRTYLQTFSEAKASDLHERVPAVPAKPESVRVRT